MTAQAVSSATNSATLGEVSAFITKGSTPTTYGFKWEKSGVLFLRSECVGERGLDLGQSMFISAEANKALRRSQVTDGDILLTITGNVGRVIRLDGIGDANINQHIARIRVKDERVDRGYVYHFLSQRSMRDYYESIVTGQAYPQISLAQVRDTKIPVPSIGEQRAISAALDDVDESIAALERLIAKKQAIRQGLMQQLLTGKTRLSGRHGTWTTTELGSILSFKNGLNKGKEYFGEGTPIVNFMDLMRGPIITADDVVGRVTLTRDEIGRFSAKQGDIFFTRTSETVDEVGTAAALIADVPDATFSGFILRARPKTAAVDARFLAYLFELNAVRQQVTSMATYTTRALTNGRSLGRVIIDLPEVTEQREVVDVLTDVDHEIDSLRGRVAKARNVKQGMMRGLLTVRTRLAVEDMAA